MGTNTDAFNLATPVETISDQLSDIRETYNKQAPDLGACDDVVLIDLLGAFRKIKSTAEMYEKAISGLLKGKLPAGETFTGQKFEFFITMQMRRDIDRDLLKQEFGEDWYQEHCKESEVVLANCRPIPEEERED